MFEWFKQYNEASSQTKYFILNWLIYGLAIIITTIYCYGRLDFVRSYKTPAIVEAKQTQQSKERAQDDKQPPRISQP